MKNQVIKAIDTNELGSEAVNYDKAIKDKILLEGVNVRDVEYSCGFILYSDNKKGAEDIAKVLHTKFDTHSGGNKNNPKTVYNRNGLWFIKIAPDEFSDFLTKMGFKGMNFDAYKYGMEEIEGSTFHQLKFEKIKQNNACKVTIPPITVNNYAMTFNEPIDYNNEIINKINTKLSETSKILKVESSPECSIYSSNKAAAIELSQVLLKEFSIHSSQGESKPKTVKNFKESWFVQIQPEEFEYFMEKIGCGKVEFNTYLYSSQQIKEKQTKEKISKVDPHFEQQSGWSKKIADERNVNEPSRLGSHLG